MVPKGRWSHRVDVSAATFLRGLALVILVWLWLRLWQWVLVFVLAAFLAIALDPIVVWLETHRIRRAYAAPLVVLSIMVVLGSFVFASATMLVEQAGLLGAQFDDLRQELTSALPSAVQQMLFGSGSSNLSTRLETVGRALAGGLAGIGVALVVVVYLLLDGRRTYDWFMAFAPSHARGKVHETADAARTVIAAYVQGNVITSTIAAVVTWILLSALQVPAALLLAVLAGVLNFIPVIGLVLSGAPAVLLGFTVSAAVGVGVAVFYVLYNLLENYYIQPKVYGRQLRLSDLAVIGGFLVGAELGGVLGAIVALPIVAMYPAVERVWAKGPSQEHVAAEHRRVASQPEH
jgi:predicted PurR-regulated permease PerM